MALSLASNPISLRAQGRVQRTTNQLSKTMERLSSGLRINDASDDPAGLSIADALRADTRLATVAIRNVNDGISVTEITDGAMAEITNMLTRMAELAEQSTNGVYTAVQRSALSSEFLALGSEITRIAVTTTFNGFTLLSNSSTINIQAGLNGTSNAVIALTGVLGTLESLGLANGGSAALRYSLLAGVTDAAAQSSSQLALDAVNAAISSVTVRRGTLGASESRLTYAVENLGVLRENLVAAESAIRDADVAADVAEMVRLQVLQQAGTAMLAQANLQPQIALKVIQGQ